MPASAARVLVGNRGKFYGNGRRLRDGLEIRKKIFCDDCRKITEKVHSGGRLRFRPKALKLMRELTSNMAADILDDMVTKQEPRIISKVHKATKVSKVAKFQKGKKANKASKVNKVKVTKRKRKQPKSQPPTDTLSNSDLSELANSFELVQTVATIERVPTEDESPGDNLCSKQASK